MKTIMIVEDDAKIGAALKIRFKAAGYAVLVITDGLRSFIRAIADKPDLIIMDIYLPLSSGLEVAEELKNAGLDDIPIIFMTASRERHLIAEAKRLNAAGFFEKPFNSDELMATVDRILQAKPAVSEEIKT